MSRSGYSDDWDGDGLPPELYYQAVARAIKGKRGQAFLRELATAMDAMPEKVLIEGDLVDEHGDCCTMGVVFKSRGIDAEKVDPYDRNEVADAIGIAPSMAAEIAYANDQDFCSGKGETPEQRWVRMRAWVKRELGGEP